MSITRREAVTGAAGVFAASLLTSATWGRAASARSARVSDKMPPPSWKVIDGLRIRYVDSGSRAGPNILLLSPWPESLFGFAEIWQPLTRVGRVVAVDLPGIGLSQGRADLMSPPPMGKFLERIIQAFSLHKPHVIGPDIGTHVALFAALDDPNLLNSAIIGSATIDETKIGDGLKMIVTNSRQQLHDFGGAKMVAAVAATLKNYKLPKPIYDDYVASYAGERFENSAAFLQAFPPALAVLRKELPTLKTPCLVIQGSEDPFVLQPNGEILHHLIPKSRLVVLPTGHSTWEDGAADYAKLAVDWIKGGYKHTAQPS